MTPNYRRQIEVFRQFNNIHDCIHFYFLANYNMDKLSDIVPSEYTIAIDKLYGMEETIIKKQ